MAYSTKVTFEINSAKIHADLNIKVLSFDEKMELTGCEIESQNDLKVYTIVIGGMYHSIDAICLNDAIEWFKSQIESGEI